MDRLVVRKRALSSCDCELTLSVSMVETAASKASIAPFVSPSARESCASSSASE